MAHRDPPAAESSQEVGSDPLARVLDSTRALAVVVTDASGAVLLWSEGARRLFGHAAALTSVFGADPLSAVFDAARRDGVHDTELAATGRDGARLSLHVTVALRSTADGALAGFLLLARDGEPERRRLALLSHDMRTPLNGIIGFTELLRAGQFGALPAEQAECLDDILTSARQLLQMIREQLDAPPGPA